MDKEIDKNQQRKCIEDLLTLMSAAAQQGNKTAQKVMDEAHNILTTDWDDIPEEIKDQMAYVTAELLCTEMPAGGAEEAQGK